jgi:MoxR-like ATPase
LHSTLKNKYNMLQTAEDIRLLNEKIQDASGFVARINDELSKVIVGQTVMVERLLIGLLSNGHILLEGVPGLAKTLAIKSLAQCIKSNFSRIQFTPDLLPADVVGTMIYNQGKNEFYVRKGPIFSNFILADEINRAPAKVQSALLEAMQERQVTIGDTSYKLDEPFLVLATQNPIEQEGTYPLPEAQVDRFMLKVVVGYPTKQEEQIIIRQNTQALTATTINAVATTAEILVAKELVRQVYVDEKIENYILDIVFATRYPEKYDLGKMKNLIAFGGSPRASINLTLAAKAYAFLNKRGYVVPDDVRNVCKDILRHRIGLTYEAEAENVKVEDIIDAIIAKVNVP